MALPSSGALSFSDIQTEFGGSNPISLSEYYGVASGIPTSGQISVSQFYGKSANTGGGGGSVQLSDYSIDSVSSESFVSSYVTVGADGILYRTGTTTFGLYNWLLSGSPGAYEARASVYGSDGGVTPGSGLNTWLNLSSSRSWGVDATMATPNRWVTYLVQIRAASGGSVLAQAYFSCTATKY